MSSPLLELPKEIRLLILEHAVADIERIVIGLPTSVPWEGKPRRYHPLVTEVSKQIRQESLPICYRDKPVILVLRYREGREQVQRWLRELACSSMIRKHIHHVSVQYFEQAHRSTAAFFDLKAFLILNEDSWIHPLTGRPLKLLTDMRHVLHGAKVRSASGDIDAVAVLLRLTEVMTAPLSKSRLLLCESMANLRMQGYTDFQLRFEVITIMYHNLEKGA